MELSSVFQRFLNLNHLIIFIMSHFPLEYFKTISARNSFYSSELARIELQLSDASGFRHDWLSRYRLYLIERIAVSDAALQRLCAVFG